MKTITLGAFKMGPTYQPMFLQLVSFLENAPKDKANPQAGFSVGDIRKRASVADAIEAQTKDQKVAWDAYVIDTNKAIVEAQKAGQQEFTPPKLELEPVEVQLEDAQYDTLKSVFDQVDFKSATRDLIPLIDAVENAK